MRRRESARGLAHSKTLHERLTFRKRSEDDDENESEDDSVEPLQSGHEEFALENEFLRQVRI